MAYRRFLMFGLLLLLVTSCGDVPLPTPVGPRAQATFTPSLAPTGPPNALRPTAPPPAIPATGVVTPGAGAPSSTVRIVQATASPAPAPATSELPGARIVALTTPAFVCRAGATPCANPAATGLQLHTGDEIQTGAGGTAILQSPTTVFHLDPDASLQFAEVQNAITRLVLRAGRLLVQHDAAGRDKITVAAGRLRVDAVDTRFTVLSNDQEVYVGVPSGGGQVAVTYAEQEPVAVQAGQQAKVECAACPPQAVLGPIPVEPLDPKEQQFWDLLSPQLQLSPTP